MSFSKILYFVCIFVCLLKTRAKIFPMRTKKQIKQRQELTLSVMAILLSIVGVIIGFASFGSGGEAGAFLFRGLFTTIGVLTYLSPVVLFFAAYLLWTERFPRLSIASTLGTILFLISFVGILSFVSSTLSGNLGVLVFAYVEKLVGTAPAVISLLLISYVSYMIVFERRHMFEMPSMFKKDSDENEDSENEEIEDENKISFLSRIKGLFATKHETVTIDDIEITEIPVEEETPNKKTLHDELLGGEEEDDEEIEEPKQKAKVEAVKPAFRINTSFIMPPVDLLTGDSGKPGAGDTVSKMKSIKATLDTFNIPVEMGSVTVGPTVTQFTLKPAQGVNVKRILGLKDNLQMALSATNMHIEAPIPGRPFVGVEIPNEKKQMLGLRNMIEHPKFQESGNLTVAIGKDIIGNPIYGNIETMPHLLIAGATRSGKSVTVQNLIMSLLYKNSPSDLKLMIIDPKRVEFTMYKNLPHLGTPVITDAKNAIKCLNWAIGEMERRYTYFADEYSGIQNLADYNKKIVAPAIEKAKKNKNVELPEILPYVVIVFDEFNDFMLSYPKEITVAITSLTQKGRAAGVHLILATQRPDVKVITGTIKANITARIALKTSSSIDSRTIIDQIGAEDLLGNGDMLYLDPNHSRPTRIQAPFVSSEEVRAVIDYVKSAYHGYELEHIDISKASMAPGGAVASSDLDDEDDESEPNDDVEYTKAKDYVTSTGRASASALQSRYGWGYPKANKFIMMMERFGVVSSLQNNKREVLVKSDPASQDIDE